MHVGISGKWCLKWVLPFLFTSCVSFLYLPGVPKQHGESGMSRHSRVGERKTRSKLFILVPYFNSRMKYTINSISILLAHSCILHVLSTRVVDNINGDITIKASFILVVQVYALHPWRLNLFICFYLVLNVFI